MKAICVVAHPDDCVIFAWPFIDTFAQFDWTILYLTYDTYTDRGKEISDFWTKRKIKTEFLGHIDTYLDIESNKISFDSELARRQLITKAIRFDLILTHNQNGEYGHIHHKFVHESLSILNKPKVFFADSQSYNFICNRTSKLDLDELPLHKDVVSGFTDIEIGKYFKNDSAWKFLNDKI